MRKPSENDKNTEQVLGKCQNKFCTDRNCSSCNKDGKFSNITTKESILGITSYELETEVCKVCTCEVAPCLPGCRPPQGILQNLMNLNFFGILGCSTTVQEISTNCVPGCEKALKEQVLEETSIGIIEKDLVEPKDKPRKTGEPCKECKCPESLCVPGCQPKVNVIAPMTPTEDINEKADHIGEKSEQISTGKSPGTDIDDLNKNIILSEGVPKDENEDNIEKKHECHCGSVPCKKTCEKYLERLKADHIDEKSEQISTAKSPDTDIDDHNENIISEGIPKDNNEVDINKESEKENLVEVIAVPTIHPKSSADTKLTNQGCIENIDTFGETNLENTKIITPGQIDKKLVEVKADTIEQTNVPQKPPIFKTNSETTNKFKCGCKRADEFSEKVYTAEESSFAATLLDLELSLKILHEKCKAKDFIINAMAEEVKMHSKTKSFDSLLKNVAHNPDTPRDYDKYTLVKVLPKPKHETGGPFLTSCVCEIKGPETSCECAIDSSPLEITDMKRITQGCVLIKWKPAQSEKVLGYEICLEGLTKLRVPGRKKDCSVIESVVLRKENNIIIYAFTKSGRCHPAATGVYKILY